MASAAALGAVGRGFESLCSDIFFMSLLQSALTIKLRLLMISWDPSPVAFEIFSFTIYWYSIFFAIGFLLAAWVVRRLAIPQIFNEEEYDRFVWYIFLGMLIGARLGHVLFYDFSSYLEHPIEIVMIRNGGLASHGAGAGMFIALWIFCKRYNKRILQLVDLLALIAPLAGGFIRIGNFFNQEIVGTPSSLPWAVLFGHPMENIPPVPVHPVQIYEALLYFALFGIGIYLYPMKKPGRLTGVMFLGIFTGRFLLEFVKFQDISSLSQTLSTGQLLSIPFIAIAIYLLLYKKSEA